MIVDTMIHTEQAKPMVRVAVEALQQKDMQVHYNRAITNNNSSIHIASLCHVCSIVM
jgi:hypothetical protein